MEEIEIVEVDIGQESCYAVDTDLSLYKWGKIKPSTETLAGLGNGVYIEKDPEFVPEHILCCSWATFGIDEDGIVKGWGVNVNGLLDIPQDTRATKLSSYSNLTVVAIGEDNAVSVWGNNGANSWVMNRIPAEFRANEVKLFDTFCLAVDTQNIGHVWGFDADLRAFGIVKTLAAVANGQTIIVHLESGKLASWHSADFVGARVIPPEIDNEVVDYLDGYGNYYVAVSKGKLFCWSYNEAGNITNISWTETNTNVKSVRLRSYRSDEGIVPIVGVIYTNNKIGVFGASLNIDKRMKMLPADIAYYIGQRNYNDCTEFLPVLPAECVLKQIAVGSGFTLALKKDNTIVGWGLGDGDVLNIPDIKAKYIAAGFQCAAAITMNDTLVTWGNGLNSAGIQTIKIKKVVLRCVSGVGIALGIDGRVHVFGDNDAEILRIQPPANLLAYDIDCNTNEGNTWVAAIQTSDRNVVQWGPGAKAPSFAEMDDVDVAKWAKHFGLRFDESVDKHALIEDISQSFAETHTIPIDNEGKRVAVGLHASFAISMSGIITAWGLNTIGELQVPEGFLFFDIRAGETVYGMTKEKPYIKRWGPPIPETRAVQALVPENRMALSADFKNIKYIEYGGLHAAAINNACELRLFGPNRFNECGPVSKAMLKLFAKPTGPLFGKFIGMAANPYYGCAIKEDGTIVVWGGKQVNNPTARYANLPPPGLNGVKKVFSAGSKWFALLQDGTVKYWNITTPSKLIQLDKPQYRYSSISINENVALGIVEGSGIVVAIGEDGYGIKKHVVPSLKTGGCKYVYAAPDCALAIDSDDSLVMWGTKYNEALRPPEDLGPVKSVICSRVCAVAIRIDGTLRSWGIPDAQHIVAACPAGVFKSIDIYRGTCIGIREDNSIVEWGSEMRADDLAFKPGLLGRVCVTSGDTGFNAVIDMEGHIHVCGGNDTVEQRYPERSVLIPGGVPGVLLSPEGLFEEKPNATVQTVLRSDLGVSLIAAAGHELGFVKADGSVVLWRSASTDLHFVPRHLTGVDLFALGPKNCIARNGAGNYIAWGEKNAIVNVPENLDAKKIVVGAEACLAIQQDDTLLMWGYDLPKDLVGKTFRDIAACGIRFAAVATDGTIHMWGHYDQPAIWNGPVGAISISIGVNHYVALLENSDVLCWGVSNEYKQLSVPAGLKATKVCCGSRFTVALTMDNRLVAWGWPRACVRIPEDVRVESFVCGNDFVLAKLDAADGYVIWGQSVSLAPTEIFIQPDWILDSISKDTFRKPGTIVSQIIMNRRSIKELPLDDKVYDMRAGKERKLTSFLLQNQGNAVVFRYNRVQTGILKSDIRDDILLEDPKQDVQRKGVFYECRRMAQLSDENGGQFTFNDVYSYPYVLLNLINGNFLISMTDAERIFKQNQFWVIKDAGYELPFSSSYWGVVMGQPSSSMLHCQEGSRQRVFTLDPYEFIDETEENSNAEEPEPDHVFVQEVGKEERVQISIADSKQCLSVKQKYAEIKGLNVAQIRLYAGGKVLNDADNVHGGFVLLARIGETGGRKRSLRNKVRYL